MNVHVSNDEADSVRAPNLVSPLYYALQTEARFPAYICKYGHQRMDEAGADRSEREGSETRLFGMRPPPDRYLLSIRQSFPSLLATVRHSSAK